MARIAVLHPGEMGAAIGAALVGVGHDVGWLPAGRGPATQRRAASAGLVGRNSVDGCDVVVSICPPAFALDTARSAQGFAGMYIDANAISPAAAAAVAEQVSDSGAQYVDAAVIGPPPVRAGTTRLYLSGPQASAAAALFDDALIEARVLTTGPYAASALKMTYAAWTKISAGLLVASRAAADELGVGEALDAEWALSQPNLAGQHSSALTSVRAKGWRWEEEMRQIAQTFAAAGEPAGFGDAAAELFARFGRPADS